MTQDAALPRVDEAGDQAAHLAAQVVAGHDALVEGGHEAVLRVLSAGAGALRGAYNVVEVSAPSGGLSLSSLMAQLSGRADFDAQDDSVLELGFRRLAMPEDGRPTALLLDAAAGLQRPVLRYLQHVGRNALGLVYVIGAAPGLLPVLDEAGFAPLRARLLARPAMVVGASEVAAAGAVEMVSDAAAVAAVETLSGRMQAAPVAGLPLALLSEPGRTAGRSRRTWPWLLAGAGMAASLAVGAWLGKTVIAPEPTVQRVAGQDAGPAPGAAGPAPIGRIPIETAVAPSPGLAKASPIELAPVDRSAGALALAAPPDQAAFAAVTPALVPPASVAPAGHAPSEVSNFEYFENGGSAAETGTLGEARTRAEPAALPPHAPAVAVEDKRRVDPTPRTRTAAAPSRAKAVAAERRQHWPQRSEPGPEEREPEVARYEWESRMPRAYAPAWRGARYAPAPGGPYIGTYTTDPYGARVFRYEQP